MVKQLEFWADNVPARPVIILISGKAGTGKDTVSQFIIEQLMDLKLFVVHEAFARSVKDAAIDYFAWDGEKDNKGRKLLQQIGKVGREYNKSVWVESVFERLDLLDYPYDVVIISDWRFPDEKKWIDNTEMFQIITIRVEAPDRELLLNKEAYYDESETALDNEQFDLTIYNLNDINNLKENCNKIVDKFFKGEK